MYNSEQLYRLFEKYGSVKMTAKAVNLQPSGVRLHLKKHAEKTGRDPMQFHTPSQTDKINEYTPQTFNGLRQLMSNDTMSILAVCEKDGTIRAVAPHNAFGNLIGVYEKGSPSEYMRDDLYWYITNVMEARHEHV